METFRWNDWNVENATKHGCTVGEIESIVLGAGRGFPRYIGNEKWLVQGRGTGGRFVEVIYIRSPFPVIYVIHAMIMTTRRRRGHR